MRPRAMLCIALVVIAAAVGLSVGQAVNDGTAGAVSVVCGCLSACGVALTTEVFARQHLQHTQALVTCVQPRTTTPAATTPRRPPAFFCAWVCFSPYAAYLRFKHRGGYGGGRAVWSGVPWL